MAEEKRAFLRMLLARMVMEETSRVFHELDKASRQSEAAQSVTPPPTAAPADRMSAKDRLSYLRSVGRARIPEERLEEASSSSIRS